MLAACHHAELGPKGVKVWAFNPGYSVTSLSGTGEAGIQVRIANGAGDPKDRVEGIVACVGGKRDADVGKFIGWNGVHPW